MKKRILGLALSLLVSIQAAQAQYFPPSGGGGVPAGYTGQATITTLGTIVTGTWNGTAISSTYLDAQTAYKNVTNVFTLVQTLTGGATPATAGGAALGTAALPFSDLYVGGAATNNTRITGTATAARTLTLPDANSNTVQPDTGAANNFLTGISSAGVISKAQPAFTNLSGSVAAAQMPALTGDVTTSAGAVATTIANSAVSNAKMANMSAHTFKGNNTAGSSAPLDLTQAQMTADLNVATDTLQGMVPATTDGKILVGKTGAAIQAVSPGGDMASVSNTGAFTLSGTVNSNVGSFTNASITVNAKGLVTAASTGAAGGGTVNTGATGNAAFYPSPGGTIVGPLTSANFAGTNGSTLTLGLASSATGILALKGTTSGTTNLTVPAAAGGVNIVLPTVATTGPTANPGTSGTILTATTGGVQSYATGVTATTSGDLTATTSLNVGPGASGGSLSIAGLSSGSVTVNAPAVTAASTVFTFASTGAAENLQGLGGSGSDSAVTFNATTAEGRVYNATTVSVTTADSTCGGCVINASGTVTLNNTITLQTNSPSAAQTAIGAGAAGGYGATAATSAGDTAGGVGAGQGGNNTGLIGAGGGAGSAASGGNGGGATVASATGEGGLNGSGTSHFSGNLNGSGGGGGGSGSGGTGGNGGCGAGHMTVITAGGFASTGSLAAKGAAGAAGATLGSGGGGGGGGTVEIFVGNGVSGATNLPAMTITVVGGAGGASAGTAANPGGGGGGYIGGTVNGTTASATFTVTGGAAGTGGSGTAGAAGGAGLANVVASKMPNLPTIGLNHMHNNFAGKSMCYVLLARRAAIFHQENESEESHKFIWDGEKGQHIQPLSYVASTYAAGGTFDRVYTALLFGGDKSISDLCDDTVKDEVHTCFDKFKDSPIKGEMPTLPGKFCGGLEEAVYADRT